MTAHDQTNKQTHTHTLTQMGRLTSDFHALERKLDKEHNEKLDLQQKLADTKAPLQALQAEKVPRRVVSLNKNRRWL